LVRYDLQLVARPFHAHLEGLAPKHRRERRNTVRNRSDDAFERLRGAVCSFGNQADGGEIRKVRAVDDADVDADFFAGGDGFDRLVYVGIDAQTERKAIAGPRRDHGKHGIGVRQLGNGRSLRAVSPDYDDVLFAGFDRLADAFLEFLAPPHHVGLGDGDPPLREFLGEPLVEG
jgi:hypothetical protein